MRTDMEARMRTTGDSIREAVREKYGEAARRVSGGERAACCPEDSGVAPRAGSAGAPEGRGDCGCSSAGVECGCSTAGGDCGCSTRGKDPITGDLYSAGETSGLPEAALLASLGCGNPTALADLHPGETVLDLGSGGGIDVLLSARRVGPGGKAYGLDMTEEMLELARRNQRTAGVANAEFLRGHIESIPLPDESVDVVISNCVINLSADKPAVLAEAFRVLRPGGRFAVSDIVVRGAMDGRVRRSLELWAGCLAGALEEAEYDAYLRGAGFVDVEIEPTRVYDETALADMLEGLGSEGPAIARAGAGRFMAAFVRARKPA